jgi:hypothetical protein
LEAAPPSEEEVRPYQLQQQPLQPPLLLLPLLRQAACRPLAHAG